MKRKFLLLLVLFGGLISALHAFEGNGTEKIPYLISSYDDIKKLSADVDAGREYSGIHFKQTTDIIFPNGENWNPIGNIDDAAFCGIYDGAGHTVSNVNCTGEYAGLFENLSGEVRNLGIESGSFSGTFAGAIAAVGDTNARIINCYSKASVHGETAGGIAGNFSGNVSYCWGLGETDGAGIVCAGNAQTWVQFCYTTANALVDFSAYAGNVTDSYTVSDKTLPSYLQKEYRTIAVDNIDAFSGKSGVYVPVMENGELVFSDDGAAILESARSEERLAELRLREQRNSFAGKGTKENPYRISSYADLCRLRDSVAARITYEDCYFEQTEDISFPSDELWKPIGNVQKSIAFRGVYDGKNHSISGIRCIDQYAGLFALLDGEVKNLRIEDGFFYGDTVGSVTSHGGRNLKIAGCQISATVTGVSRAGGITDNAGGVIQDCVFLGEVRGTNERTVVAAVTSYNTPKIFDCTVNDRHTYDFAGSGTRSSPFIIADYADLEKLGGDIALGVSYSGSYFVQTADIVIPDGTNWNPIGDFASGTAFCGIYDGAGHTVSNINCATEYAGLFGYLAGTVANLGVKDGSISGMYAGGISAQSTSDARVQVLNCWSTAALSGEHSGGIVAAGNATLYCCYTSASSFADFSVYGGAVSDSYFINERTPHWLPKIYPKLTGRDTPLAAVSDAVYLPVYADGIFSFADDNETVLSVFASFEKDSDRHLFDGEGTKKEPYKITSYDDLCRLRDNVDKKISYEGCYFLQTEDIVFPDGESWNPIGDLKDGIAFCGVYDGGGHSVRNILCFDGFAGLFALLGGEVRNLGIESGFFYGDTVGGITSHGWATMRVTNCYNKATVMGRNRAGGLTDNVGGIICNCQSMGEVKGTTADTVLAGICSYGKPKIRRCISVFKPIVNEKTFSGTLGANRKEVVLLSVIAVLLLAFAAFYCMSIFARTQTPLSQNLLVGGKKSNSVFLLVFALITIFSLCSLFFGDKYSFYFFVDKKDSFMDFFNSIVEDKNRGGNIGIYPPLPRLHYKVLARFIPWEAFDDSLSLRQQAFALRDSVYGTVVFTLYNLLFIVPLIAAMYYSLKGSAKEKWIYIAMFCFSGIFIYTIERGNCIIFAFLFTLLFILLYDNPKYRQLAYLSLALAASIKLYPAVFGLLLLSKKDYKGCFVVFAEFCIIYAVSYLLCGFTFQTNNVQKLISWSGSKPMRGNNWSAKNILRCASYVINKVAGMYSGSFVLPKGVFWVSKIFLLGTGIFSYFYSEKVWKKLCVLSLLCIFVPDMSGSYTLIFLFLPLMAFLNEKDEEKLSVAYAVLFAILMPLLIIPVEFGHFPNQASGRFIVQSVMLVVLYFAILVQSAQNFVKGKRK